MTIKHAFQSAKADGTDATLVRPSNWNADHQVDADGVDTATAIPLVIGGANASEVVVGRDGIATKWGRVWIDIPTPLLQASGAAALTVEQYRDTGLMCLKMRHDQDDQVSISPEVDHGWVVDTECRVHLHYTPLVTPATNQVVRIAYSFCWAHVNQEIPAAAGWTSGTTDITIPSSGADTNQKKIASLFSTTPSGGSAASILHVKLTRLSSSAGDSYTTPAPSGTTTANIVMWAAGVHQLVDKPGTVAELPS